MDKDLSRREFLKLSGLTGSGLLFAGSMTPKASAPMLRLLKEIGETTSICPYCAVGCGMIVAATDGKVTNIEGDSEHPINRGALCSKGGTLSQLANSPQRVTKPKYRASGGTGWEEVEWGWALDERESDEPACLPVEHTLTLGIDAAALEAGYRTWKAGGG